MSTMEEAVATFAGGVQCRRPAAGPIGLVLIGRSAGRPDCIWLAFEGMAPQDLPAVIEDATVQESAVAQYRIASRGREWILRAAHLHVHRDVATAFYGAVPPRIVPWSKRLLWRTVLALAATPAGRWLLRARAQAEGSPH